MTQRPTSFYAIPQGDARIWMSWADSDRETNASWGSSGSTSRTLVEDFTLDHTYPKTHYDVPMPLACSVTPPTPDATDSDRSSSRLSIDSFEYDDMPEIPFVSSSPVQYASAWHRRDSSADHDPHYSSVDGCELTAHRSIALLGHTPDRVLARRQRTDSESISSLATASSRSKPAPAKSILSSSSSIRTRTGRSAASVKFLEVPEVHYEHYEEREWEPEPARVEPMGPPPLPRGKSRFFNWILKPMKKSSQPVTAKPDISGPLPLGEKPFRRTPLQRDATTSSLCSKTSISSMGSTRSCGSKLQMYFGRIARQDT